MLHAADTRLSRLVAGPYTLRAPTGCAAAHETSNYTDQAVKPGSPDHARPASAA